MFTHPVLGKVRSKAWRHNLTLLLLALVLGLVVACGGDEEEPTVAPTATPAPAAQVTPDPTATSASASPLAAPVSPLADPNSPLPTPEPQSEAPANTVAVTKTVSKDAVEMQPVTDVEIEGLAIKEGTGAVRGKLISTVINAPLPDAVVRLAEVYCPGDLEADADKREACVWALDDAFSPSTFTDAEGSFVFESIEARDYVLLVGDMMTRYVMLKDAEDKPLMWTVPADQAIDIGEYHVNY